MAEMPMLPSPIVEAIDRRYEAEREYDDYYPTLRASEIGHECERRLWYRFRWAVPAERFSGRMLRLFETGEREEARMLDWLRDIGCTVLDRNPATRLQWRVVLVDGHLTGSCDARTTGVPSAPVVEHVVECKTHNDKSFRDLVDKGVMRSKWVHYAQMQIYMLGLGLTRALYIAKNKNDDAIHAERVHYDPAVAVQLFQKAERIIKADQAPPRAYEPGSKLAAFKCGSCPALGACHQGQRSPMGRNCRTCLHSHAAAASGWQCNRHGKSLTPAEQRVGCPHHLYLPDLVPGKQIDADEEAEMVAYKMADGSTWIDGGSAVG